MPGLYVCDGGLCTLEWKTGAMGDFITIPDVDGVSLYFKADNPETLLPDSDYLTFGVWMIAQDGPATSGYIRPIAMAGADAFGSDELAALKGSAKYEGEATGYYATRAAGSVEAESGRFTATATVTANFDTGSMVPTADDDNATKTVPLQASRCRLPMADV